MRRKGPEERRALVDGALCPDSAAVAVDNSVDRRKPDTRTRETRLDMETLERREKPIRISHIEARAVITYEIGGAPGSLRHAELDDRLTDAWMNFHALPNRFSSTI